MSQPPLAVVEAAVTLRSINKRLNVLVELMQKQQEAITELMKTIERSLPKP